MCGQDMKLIHALAQVASRDSWRINLPTGIWLTCDTAHKLPYRVTFYNDEGWKAIYDRKHLEGALASIGQDAPGTLDLDAWQIVS